MMKNTALIAYRIRYNYCTISTVVLLLRTVYHLDCRLDDDTRQMPIAASAIGTFLVIVPCFLMQYKTPCFFTFIFCFVFIFSASGQPDELSPVLRLFPVFERGKAPQGRRLVITAAVAVNRCQLSHFLQRAGSLSGKYHVVHPTQPHLSQNSAFHHMV